MIEWESMTLGDLIDVKHGYAFKGRYFSTQGDEIVLTPGNFPIGGGLRFRRGKDRYYTGPYPSEYRLSPGQLLVVMTDLKQEAPILGSPAFVPDEPAVLHNQRLGLVTIKPGISLDRRFLFYLLLSDATRSQLRETATGSTVRHTAPERIYRVEVRIPPLHVQRTISSVLGALDDLVESNRRQVEVLEQMVEATYQEWFVRFRYPGHEGVPFVGSALGPIPEGWEIGRVDRHILLQRGFDLPGREREAGLIPVMGASGRQGSHSTRKVIGPGITTGRSGTVGVVTYVPKDFWPLNTTLWVKEFRLATPRSAYFLLASLNLAQAASGAAVPTLNRNHVHALPTICPPRGLIEEWDSVALPMFESATSLRQRSKVLSELRDHLLPRLVSGRIDLSLLDLDGP